MPPSPLLPGVLVLDRTQRCDEAQATKDLLEYHLAHGPWHVTRQVWTWGGFCVLYVTTAN